MKIDFITGETWRWVSNDENLWYFFYLFMLLSSKKEYNMWKIFHLWDDFYILFSILSVIEKKSSIFISSVKIHFHIFDFWHLVTITRAGIFKKAFYHTCLVQFFCNCIWRQDIKLQILSLFSCVSIALNAFWNLLNFFSQGNWLDLICN